MKTVRYIVLFMLLVASFTSVLSYAGDSVKNENPVAQYASKESRLRSVFDYLLSVSEGGESISVSEIKTVIDFAGNLYYVAECVPTGYIIYCDASGIFTEYSMTSISPYFGASGTLYYGGPTYYYAQNNIEEDAVGLLYPDETLSRQAIADFAKDSQRYCEYNKAQANVNVLTYVENGNVNVSFAQVVATLPAPVAMEYGKLTHPNFFVDCTNPCGYAANLCAYTALALQIAYRDKYRDNNYMDEIYWQTTDRVKLRSGSASFAYYLRSNYGSSDGVSINEIKAVSEAYCKARGISATHTAKSTLGFSRSTIMNAIDSDTPVMLAGKFTSPSSGTKYEHAVVAYAYYNNTSLFGTTTYVVHYGIDGYSNITLSETISSIYMLG